MVDLNREPSPIELLCNRARRVASGAWINDHIARLGGKVDEKFRYRRSKSGRECLLAEFS